MKAYSQFSQKYVTEICNALNDAGFKMDKITGRSFNIDEFDTMTQFLQDYVVRSHDIYHYLTSKNLVNRGFCPYTGQEIDSSFPSWSFMQDRKIHLSHEGMKIMKKEDDEEYEKVFGAPRPVKAPSSGGGCYIATVCYEDQYAPEVIAFKAFRDEYLSKTWYGRFFIKMYYTFSPKIAEYLEGKSKINGIIRTHFLDKIFIKVSKRPKGNLK